MGVQEYAENAVRGIPEKSYGKIPKYLHMLKEAKPGTHTHYVTDSDDRFKYLFILFGQSIKGFYQAIRRVIVVDSTFLKGKYKRVLLVATTLDSNSNLYPIAFGVVDSEKDLSWERVLRKLNIVIADDQILAFISDQNTSVIKTLAKVFTQSTHGICIHHLLTNVVTYFKTRGLTGLIAKASKEYRVGDFERKFNDIKNISLLVGNYLVEAGVEKWARCKFPGFMYNVRTTNPAESINAALKSPREYPYDLLKIPCRHAIKAAFSVDRELHPLTDDMYTTAARRKAYEECINPISVPEDSWQVPVDVENARVLPPETRGAADFICIDLIH
ncbi:uncharacterized protein LOC112088093 [Eutrema salsugineum]|uniref:uncharacterized protein LOC112088093 n=1 Tax=Eutrema salsugineum TaxID=72664 RepID=UPI000CED50E3|nr:uncharacterized protein LOC112088093 [Eutrema salsugineum]